MRNRGNSRAPDLPACAAVSPRKRIGANIAPQPSSPRRCFVPGDWLDGIGVRRGVLFLKERLGHASENSTPTPPRRLALGPTSSKALRRSRNSLRNSASVKPPSGAGGAEAPLRTVRIGQSASPPASLPLRRKSSWNSGASSNCRWTTSSRSCADASIRSSPAAESIAA